MVRSIRRVGTAMSAAALSLALVSTAPGAQAAVTVDSTPDTSWRVNGRVYATVVVNDTVFVGGTFTSAVSPSGATVPRANLAAFDLATGEVLTEWRADTNATVRALDLSGSSLYVGGDFTSIAGSARSRAAEVSTETGTVDPTFDVTANNSVRAVEADGGSVYLGGTFTNINGRVKNRIVKVSAATGAVDTTFKTTTGGAVYALKKLPGSATLYAGGAFTAMSGVARDGLAALSATTGAVLKPVFSGAVRSTLALDLSADGSVLYAGNTNNVAAAYSTSRGNRLWRLQADGDVQAIRYGNGTVYFGFHDGYGGDTRLRLLAADARTGTIEPAFMPTFVQFWGIFAIDITPSGGLVVGGEFRSISGVPVQGWAEF